MAHDPESHQRRSIRLRGYDYSRAGAYFITICTQDRACLFGDVVDGVMRLNEAGQMIQSVWDEMLAFYPGVNTDAFVVMPNHVHGIVVLVGATPRGRPVSGDHPGSGQARGPAPTADHPGSGQVRGPAPTADHPASGQARGPAPTADHPGSGQARGPAPAADRPASGQARGPAPTADHPASGQARGPAPTADHPASGQARGPAPTADHPGSGQARGPAPTVPTLSLPDVVHRFKTLTTKRYADGVKQSGWVPFPGRLWQRNYYEHIIRDEESLNGIRQYVLENPMRWAFDRENIAAASPEPEEAWRR